MAKLNYISFFYCFLRPLVSHHLHCSHRRNTKGQAVTKAMTYITQTYPIRLVLGSRNKDQLHLHYINKNAQLLYI